MLALQRGFSLALVSVVTAGVAFACSSGLPDEDPHAGSAGNAGSGVSGQEDAGTSNGGANLGGNSSNEAGADSAAGDGGADSVDPNGAQGGKNNAQGGRQSGSDGGNAHGGAAGGGPAGGVGGDDLFALGAPSSDCQAAAPVELAVPPAPGLNQAPVSGHACNDTFEPNDADACQLALGTPIATQLSKPSDPVDKFVFHAEANVDYTLIVSALDCKGVSSLDAIHVTATSLASSGPVTQLNALAYLGQKDAFTIAASSAPMDKLITFTADASCAYDFKLVQSTVQGLVHGADHEPNDTPTTARPIKLNRLVSSRLSNPSDRRDYFTVPVQANLTYSIHVSTKGCSGSSSLDSMTVQGQSLSANDPVTNLGITAYLNGVYNEEFSTKTSGQELLMFSVGQTCEYEFYVIPSTICGLGHDENSFEPNDTASTAAPILLGQTIRAEIQADDATDYYGFAVEPNSQYALSLSASTCKGTSSLDSLTAELWSGRAKEVKKESKLFYFGKSDTLTFTSGSSPQQLLKITGGQSCGYEFSITKG